MSDELITAEVVEMAARAYKRVSWSDPDEKAMHAALTAVFPALIEKAREAEREACAKIAIRHRDIDCEWGQQYPDEARHMDDRAHAADAIAAAIRARTQPETQEPTP